MTDDNMPEPAGSIYFEGNQYEVGWISSEPAYSADQLRAALAAQAEKHAAEIAELRDRPITDSTYLGLAEDIAALTAERDALRAEVEALRAALKPFADADLTLPTVRDTFGFDVLRARAALAAQAEKHAAEVERYKSTMIAAAEEIHAHWDAHCDAEGYGPANLMHRLERGIAAEYGYTAGNWARMTTERDALRAEVKALRADAERYRWLRDIDPDPVCSLPQLFTETGKPEDVDAAIDAARSGGGK